VTVTGFREFRFLGRPRPVRSFVTSRKHRLATIHNVTDRQTERRRRRRTQACRIIATVLSTVGWPY